MEVWGGRARKGRRGRERERDGEVKERRERREGEWSDGGKREGRDGYTWVMG